MIAVFLISMLLPWNAQAKTKSIVNCKSKKYSYSDMKKDIQQLAKKYPDYCSYKVIGKTRQGRNIYDFMIGNPEAVQYMQENMFAVPLRCGLQSIILIIIIKRLVEQNQVKYSIKYSFT